MKLSANYEEGRVIITARSKSSGKEVKLDIDADNFDKSLLEMGICQDRINLMWELYFVGLKSDFNNFVEKYTLNYFKIISNLHNYD